MRFFSSFFLQPDTHTHQLDTQVYKINTRKRRKQQIIKRKKNVEEKHLYTDVKADTQSKTEI